MWLPWPQTMLLQRQHLQQQQQQQQRQQPTRAKLINKAKVKINSRQLTLNSADDAASAAATAHADDNNDNYDDDADDDDEVQQTWQVARPSRQQSGHWPDGNRARL